MDKTITYTLAIIAVAALVVATYGYIVFEGEISDLNGSVSDLQEGLTTSQTTISNLDGSIGTIEGQLETILDQLSVYQSAITDLEEQMGIYNSNMSALEQQLSEQQEQIAEYQETIQEQQEQIAEYQEVTLVDAIGNVVTLTSAPERIVSLSPSNTEIVFAVGAGDSIVGVTDYCNYPHNFTAWIEAGNMTSIGNFWQPSVEPIVALEPDLVLASSGSSEAAGTLRTLGYAVLVVDGQTIDEVLQDVLLIGRATYKNSESVALVTEMRERIDAVVNQAADVTTTPKVYHEVWNDPLMSAGPTTFIDEMIVLAGGENIFHDATTSWPIVSSEAIIEKNPGVMFFPDMYMGRTNFYETMEAVENRAGWDTISAVQNEALYEIDADIISRSGPRIVDALETIAKMVHPEIFGQP